MAATISFWGDTLGVQNLSGSGLGFYGSTFGNSVEVGSYQDSTYITDGAGATQGPAVNNNKYIHPESGTNSVTGDTHLQYIPNRVATLNIRFTNDSAVRTQNTKLRIFDRSNINNPASGVTTKVAQIIHPDPNQANPSNSSDATWSTPTGSSVILSLVNSPGISGGRPMGDYTTDTQHDWYTVISASPDSIGAKTLYGLYVELEYL